MKTLHAFTAAAAAALLLISGCSRPDPAAVTSDLGTPPTGLTWVDYQGVSIPVTDQGPRTYTPQAATGFDPSPAGAAVAAIVHTTRMSLATDEMWSQIAAAELAPGPGKDAWATARVLFSITKPAETATAPKLLGYRVTAFTARERARVTVYSAYPDRSLSATHTAVVWTTGDWLLQLPHPASTDPPIEAITEIPADTVRLEHQS